MISDNFLLKLLDSTQPLEKGTLGEMATELLAYREAERKTNSWKDAPDWANFIAIDDDGCITWFENRPSHNDSFWYPDGGRYGTESLDGWQSTLQERPKWPPSK